MNEQMQLHAKQLIENREKIRTVFSWDSGLILLACAGMFTAKDRTVDVTMLQECKQLLKEKVGVFSGFRSTARTPIASMLAISGAPEKTLSNGRFVYDLLKKEFWSSTYLPLAAMLIAQMAPREDYERIVARTKQIYECMKKEHPFLTSGEDSSFCALLALSDKSNEVLLRDMEDCYQILKGNFFSSNAVQSLSHVLALCEGSPKVKCERTMELFSKLKEAGYRYGTSYELPTLGVLAMSEGSLDQIVVDMIEIDTWLSKQKGFGFFSGISSKHRLMYAGILAQKEYISEETMQTAVVNGTIATIIAQEAAMCAAVGASAAASAASSSN